MALKSFKVFFTRTSVGVDGVALAAVIQTAVSQHGLNLPIIDLSGEKFQIRGMARVGSVWKGTFVKLRDDAPHVVAADDQERELNLEDGDHLIEKCHFIYRERGNVLVWQANRSAGGLSRVEDYLSALLAQVVTLPPVMNDAEIEQVLNGIVGIGSMVVGRENRDGEWDIFVNGEEVGWIGTRDVEEDEDFVFNSDIRCINLEKVLGFGS